MPISRSGTPDELLEQPGQKQPPQVARLLLEVLANPQGEPNSDQIAGLALVELVGANPDNWALLEELLAVLANEHTSSILPRAYAARALGGTKQTIVVKPLAETLLHSSNSHLRGAAAEGLGATAKSEAIEPLGQALLDRTEDEVVRCSVAGALSDIGRAVKSERQHIAQLLRQALSSRPPSTLRENIILALHDVDG